MTETFTCASCHGTFDKGWSDEEAAAEAEGFFPGINVTDPAEAGVVCDGCYQDIMARVRAEAPELIGPGWRAGSAESGAADDLTRFLSEDCAECGTPGYQRHLSAAGGCATCAAEDPRPVYIPVRNKGILPYDLPVPPRRSPEDAAPVFPPGLGLFPSSHDGPYFAPFREGGITPPRSAARREPPGPFGECYAMASGAMVHVRPGCRCKT